MRHMFLALALAFVFSTAAHALPVLVETGTMTGTITLNLDTGDISGSGALSFTAGHEDVVGFDLSSLNPGTWSLTGSTTEGPPDTFSGSWSGQFLAIPLNIDDWSGTIDIEIVALTVDVDGDSDGLFGYGDFSDPCCGSLPLNIDHLVLNATGNIASINITGNIASLVVTTSFGVYGVPEPSRCVMVGLGLLGLVGAARRQVIR